MSEKQLGFFTYDQNGNVRPKREDEFDISESQKPIPPLPDDMPARRFKSYDEYIHSVEWRKKRAYVIYLANGRCQKCGKETPLEVHHLNYDRLYREKLTDLQAVCKDCHPKADSERKRIREAEIYQKGLNTYAVRTLKLGETWWYDHYDFAVYKFDIFLARQSHFEDGGSEEEWKEELEYMKDEYFENYHYEKNYNDAEEFNSYRDDDWANNHRY
jgi:5-methylcytosine-specific restriction endonuclease McrA